MSGSNEQYIIITKTKPMEITITAIMFETVNGKRTGKSFAFALDPKLMAKKCKTEASLNKYIESYIEKSGVFSKADFPSLKYKNKQEFIAAWKEQLSIVKAEEEEKAKAFRDAIITRVAPDRIVSLAPNEIFVFGSNAQGLHYGGAANTAVNYFGAIMGRGHGIQGQSYAIDTMSGLDNMKADIDAFVAYAKAHPELRFLVTLIGCGIAGFKPSQVAPLFSDCVDLSNVCLPSAFWEIINK